VVIALVLLFITGLFQSLPQAVLAAIVLIAVKGLIDLKELRRVVYDLSNTPYVDVAGARMLRRLHDELADKQIETRVVGAHSEVRDRLRFENLQDWVGPINRHVSLGEAVGISTPTGEPQGSDGATG
jgi:MFS superfamily sulfate permease-like transporter